MFVCICHAVTDTEIRRQADMGVRSMRELRAETGCAGSCGQCAQLAKGILDEAIEDSGASSNVVPFGRLVACG